MNFPRTEQMKLEARQIGVMYLIVIAVFLLGFLVRDLVDGFEGLRIEERIEAVAPADPYLNDGN